MSKLQVETISHTNNTTAATINSSGNVSLSGTLGVAGAATMSSTLGVTGASTIGGTLGVTGASTFSGGIANSGTISAGTLAPAVAMAAGTFIQMQYGTTTSTISTNSTSVVAASPTVAVAITPKFSNSKMIVSLIGGQRSYSSGTPWLYKQLWRDINGGGFSAIETDFTRDLHNSSYGMSNAAEYIDAPNTTNQVTYKIYISVDNSQSAYLNVASTRMVFKVIEVKV